MADAAPFKPALIVVDVQEDFCPPVREHGKVHHMPSSANDVQKGTLAVPNGRDIIPSVNKLLSLPFAFKVATKDWHPANHVSFASNHAGKKPFEDYVTIINPENQSETYSTRLWPVHCVQNTPGAELIPELDRSLFDKIVEKGQNKDVEMYSVFYSPFKEPRVADSGIAELLRKEGITHVYTVGLAADYCVKFTAVDAAAEGFTTYLIEEGTRPVDVDEWEKVKKEIEGKRVQIVSIEGPEVKRVSST
jgi:nicotinamidase-related amidase